MNKRFCILVGCAALADIACADDPIPPHRPVQLDGLHAYAQKSIAAGETLRFRISSTVPYEFDVLRLGMPGKPETDRKLQSLDRLTTGQQPIHPGSYVHIGGGLESRPLMALTLECWVRPFRVEGSTQVLISQQDALGGGGFRLYLNETGQVVFRLGQRMSSSRAGPQLEKGKWHHIVATWDGIQSVLWVNGTEDMRSSLLAPVTLPSAPLRIGAVGYGGVAQAFFDGDIAYPNIADVAVDARVIRARGGLVEAGKTPPPLPGALGSWPLDEESGAVVRDRSRHGRHGRIINQGTWMVGGPGFGAADVPRFGGYDPETDDQRGHALRLASDDLYDCRWATTCTWMVPGTAKPGIYVGRFRYEIDSKPRTYDVTFVVRRPSETEPAPILVLCSSNTWLAYNATPFANHDGMNNAWWGTNGFDQTNSEAPLYSFYRNHRAGQPTYNVGVNLPWPVAGPDVHYSPPEIGYSHLVRAERFLHGWLDAEGYEFDVATDFDLHRDPELLSQYKVLILNGHSEYWSDAAYHGVERFLSKGGNVVVFSGNTMFWRVTFDANQKVMECRKYDSAVGGSKNATPGELFHSHDGRRGGLSRECRVPAWKLLGLECSGWWGTRRATDYGVYTVRRANHFLFQGPEPLALHDGDTFGHAPDGGLPRAGGHEADIRLRTLKRMTPLDPALPTLPDEPADIVTLAHMPSGKRGVLDYLGRWGENTEGVVAEVIYWERRAGGRVFHAGTIGSGWALSADPKMQKLVRNVLHHFGVRNPRK